MDRLKFLLERIWFKWLGEPEVEIEPQKKKISDYYFSVEASEYRETIEGLRREISNERVAREAAESAALYAATQLQGIRRQNTILAYAKEHAQKLIEIIDKNEIS